MTATTRERDQDVPMAYYMGSIRIFIVTGASERPRLAIEMDRMDRADDDPLWNIIADLTPVQYERLNRLVAEAMEKFRRPGELHPWPLDRE